jgi:hypothetical protein
MRTRARERVVRVARGGGVGDGTRKDLETRSPKIDRRGGAFEERARDARGGRRRRRSKRALGM